MAALQPGPQPLGLLGVGHSGGRHQPGEAPKCGLSIVGGHQEGVGRHASTFKGEGGVLDGEGETVKGGGRTWKTFDLINCKDELTTLALGPWSEAEFQMENFTKMVLECSIFVQMTPAIAHFAAKYLL